MKLLYRIAADAVVVVHAAYVLWVVLGLALVWLGAWRGWSWIRNRWLRWTHLAMITIVVIESWLGITCPLTTWEQALRAKAGQSAYEGDFVANWVHDLLFIDAPPWAFAVAYTAFGAAVALSWWWWPPRGKQRPPPPTDPAT